MRKYNRALMPTALLLLATASLAGDLEPPAAPGPTMKSLNELPPVWSQILDSTDGEADGCDSTRFKCVMAGEAVLDMETGLVWERTITGTATGDATSSWAGAQLTCLNRTTGGRKGWHLPWVEELSSLIDPAASDPALPANHPFVDVTSDQYWTSSVLVNDAAKAMLVSVTTGSVITSAKTNNFKIWCVRGGTPSVVNTN